MTYIFNGWIFNCYSINLRINIKYNTLNPCISITAPLHHFEKYKWCHQNHIYNNLCCNIMFPLTPTSLIKVEKVASSAFNTSDSELVLFRLSVCVKILLYVFSLSTCISLLAYNIHFTCKISFTNRL